MNRRSLAALSHREVLCPHCWHEFHDDDAWFVSKHTELRGDPVILDPEAHKRFGPHEVSPDRNGIVRDPKGMEMTDRACPRCHLQIPTEMLERRPFIFSIGGAPSAGKTYFFTSMLHQLGLQMARQFKFNLSYCDSPDTRAFKLFESTLFRGPRDEDTQLEKTTLSTNTNRVSLDGMPAVLLPKPGMFRIAPTPDHPRVAAGGQVSDANFILYDNAGETFDPDNDQHRQSENQTTRHLAQSNGVMFVYDLLQDAHVRERLAGSADPQVSTVPKDCEQERTLQNVIDQARAYRGLSSRDRIDVPLAVCVQKFDAWRSLLPPWAAIDDTSIEWLEKHGLAALHVEEINRNSLFVRQLLEDVAPRFVQLAEANFSVVRYFPVSALGTTPKMVTRPGETHPYIVVRRGDINPIRITDPLLWLLTRVPEKFVLAAYSKQLKGAPMPVVAQNPSRITVQYPDAKTRLTLDWEYCGTNTVDPQSGQPCHIPVVPRPATAAAPPPLPGTSPPPSGGTPSTTTGSAPKPPPRKPGLTLDNPEGRKKKGGLWDA